MSVLTDLNAEIVPCTLFRKLRRKPNLESTSKYGFSPDLGRKNDGVLSMRMQVILDSSFARPGSVPIRGGKKGEFRDWTRFVLINCVIVYVSFVIAAVHFLPKCSKFAYFVVIYEKLKLLYIVYDCDSYLCPRFKYAIFHIFACIFTIYAYLTNSRSDQLPDGFSW